MFVCIDTSTTIGFETCQTLLSHKFKKKEEDDS